MAYNRIQAARLLTASELQVFEASLGDALSALKAPRLNALVKRARTLRDKAQDLLRRQRVATRTRTGTKAGTSGVANERTAQKVQALDEALKRLETRLERLDAAAARAADAAQRARERERLAAEKLRGRQAAARPTPAAKKAATGPAAARSSKAPAIVPRGGGKTVPPISPGALPKNALQKRKFTGSQAIQAHVGARGRRQQAKRDSRG